MNSKEVCPEIIKQYCPQTPNGMYVQALVDSEGNIGGYTVAAPITDSPISYLDANGKFLTSFHIFGSDEEKAKSTKIIDSIRKKFPGIAPLKCPDSPEKPDSSASAPK